MIGSLTSNETLMYARAISFSASVSFIGLGSTRCHVAGGPALSSSVTSNIKNLQHLPCLLGRRDTPSGVHDCKVQSLRWWRRLDTSSSVCFGFWCAIRGSKFSSTVSVCATALRIPVVRERVQFQNRYIPRQALRGTVVTAVSEAMSLPSTPPSHLLFVKPRFRSCAGQRPTVSYLYNQQKRGRLQRRSVGTSHVTNVSLSYLYARRVARAAMCA